MEGQIWVRRGYIQRERERGRERYIYIYIHIERERLYKVIQSGVHVGNGKENGNYCGISGLGL